MRQFYYKGLYKVKVVTESEGYWIVESLEDFEDCIERIVQPNDLVKKDSMPPIAIEHAYELQLEKKVKQMVKNYEKEKTKK
jgi:hypothetical protein